MADAPQQQIVIDLAPMAQFTPYEGSSDLLKQDGFYLLGTTSIKVGQSKGEGGKAGNFKFILTHNVADDGLGDSVKGATLVKHLPITGNDKNGKPNVLQLGQLMLAMSYSLEQIRGLQGKLDATTLAAQLEAQLRGGDGKAPILLAADVVAEADKEGRLYSGVAGYVTGEKYATAKSVAGLRRPHKVQQGFAGTPGGQQALVASMLPQGGQGGQQTAGGSLAPIGGAGPTAPAAAPQNGARVDPLLAMMPGLQQRA